MVFDDPGRWLILLAVASGLVSAQMPHMPVNAADLTRSYVEHSAATQDAAQNYTYVILHHDLNYIHDKLSSDTTHKSEQIFIGGLPYVRRLERNGNRWPEKI